MYSKIHASKLLNSTLVLIINPHIFRDILILYMCILKFNSRLKVSPMSLMNWTFSSETIITAESRFKSSAKSMNLRVENILEMYFMKSENKNGPKCDWWSKNKNYYISGLLIYNGYLFLYKKNKELKNVPIVYRVSLCLLRSQ